MGVINPNTKQDISCYYTVETKALAHEFEKFLTDSLGINELEKAHLDNNSEKLKYGTDQKTELHRVLYKEFDKEDKSKLIANYNLFLKFRAGQLLEQTGINDWAFQRFPSLRVQFPNNISVFEYHRDSDYNHPLGEINHFLSITKSENTGALWVEENLGWEDFKPLNLNKGEMAVLDTSIFKHGDKLNQEESTRVSIDFRAIPLSALKAEESKKSITAGRKFDIEDYYTCIKAI